MAKTANSYILPQDNRIKSAVLTADKTSHANSTDAVKILDADTDGSLIKKVWALPRATVGATKIALYWSPDNGTTVYLFDQALMAAYTEADNTAATKTEFTSISFDEPLFLPTGHSLWAGAFVALAGGIVVSALVEDY